MSIVLANAAFGDDPGRWPLPPASTPHELWLRAVVAGGQGRYGSAMADLDWRLPTAARRPVGVAGAQHPCVVLASARLARPGARVGRPGDRAGRLGPRRPVPTPSSGWPPTRSAWAGSRRRPRALRRAGELLDGDRRRRGCRCGWRGCPRSWRWPAVRVRRRCGHAERAVDLAAALGSARHTREIGRRPGGGAVQRGGARRIAAVSRRGPAGRRPTGNHPAALGVGLPAGRYRQRYSHGSRRAEDS